jgi:hypothetical protein
MESQGALLNAIGLETDFPKALALASELLEITLVPFSARQLRQDAKPRKKAALKLI